MAPTSISPSFDLSSRTSFLLSMRLLSSSSFPLLRRPAVSTSLARFAIPLVAARFTPVRCRVSRSGDSFYSPLNSSGGGVGYSDRPTTEMTPLFPGCDYEHWLIVMDKPGGEGATKQQIIDCYIQTLAKVVGSEEEAKKRIYNVSCERYFGFGCEIDEETSNKLDGLPGVLFVLPDAYVDAENKDYGGHLILGSFQSRCSSVPAAEETAIIPSEYNGDLPSDNEESTYVAIHENPEDDESVDDGKDDPENLSGHKMVRVCDKLIEVFMVDKPTTTDWRRLLAFSKEWSNIRPHFYKRCHERADAETDPGMQHKLLRLSRKLKEIDEDVQRHDELLEVIKESPSEISAIVAKRRKDFTKEFFVHLHTVAESYYENPTQQNELAKLGNACLAAVQAYDTATESIEALNAAELKFQDIINSPCVSDACKKIDNLAEKNQLDSALMLMISKAWSTAKESNMMKEEVKDILYHLYKTAVSNLQRLMPREIRILKYLLTIDDPEEQMCALKDAFTPGQELERRDVDYLYTTPQELHTWMRTVVDAYHFSREGTLIKEARDLMSPKVIQRMENLKMQVEKNFL